MKKTDDSQSVTKRDVEEIIGRVVGEALQVIANQFEAQNKRVDKRFDEIDKRFEDVDRRFDRLERKLDATIARTDSHEIRIGLLERAT